MRKKQILTTAISLLALTGCTDACKADLQSYGEKHEVIMYSGGVAVERWVSTGKVSSMSESDGWQFMDKKTGKLVRVSGDVTIKVVD